MKTVFEVQEMDDASNLKREKRNAAVKKWRANNKGIVKAGLEKWLAKHPGFKKAYAKEYRAKNLEKLRSFDVAKKIERRAWVNALKSGPCLDCGGVFHHAAMDFDHVRGEKVFHVSMMISFKMDRLKAEIEKCDLVCANCHRVRTFKRGYNNHKRSLT